MSVSVAQKSQFDPKQGELVPTHIMRHLFSYWFVAVIPSLESQERLGDRHP